MTQEKTPDLTVKIGPLVLKNPVIAASGTFGYGLELSDFVPPESLGAVIVKGLSLEPWPGNPLPRLVESSGGLINAIGLENMGVEEFIKNHLDKIKATGATVGANIIGRTVEEYAQVAKCLAKTPIDFLELNVSCPNLSTPGGLSFGSDPEICFKLTSMAVSAASGLPVFVKLPPLVTDITILAKKVEEAGATAISLINTIPAMSVDIINKRPTLAHVTGGLSGPPIKPIALRLVMLCAQAVNIPILGLGGVFTYQDALEFILVGASAVQMGTAVLIDPLSPLKVIEGLSNYLKSQKISSISLLKGQIQTA
ncbi:MAG: dihydroorotate dehydrogenase [Deltaproteobacteria bacterium]|jgi:dihydroorotate dehydrogenase (NAD+) catalytic subunit|nr:dihydroorotate dehydrogenase [Deltaproteobacteria bacterium]